MTRYKIVEGSQSGSHGFEYSIVDTTKPELRFDGVQIIDDNGQPQYEQICECFNKVEAELICNALNESAKKSDIKIFTWNSPFGVVKLSQVTVDRLNAICNDWQMPNVFRKNKDVKDILDEIDEEAGRAHRAYTKLEVY